MASESKASYLENPRVLAAVDGGGEGVVTPQPAQPGKQKINLGASLPEREQLQVLAMLEINSDRFAFSLEDIESFTGEPLQI